MASKLDYLKKYAADDSSDSKKKKKRKRPIAPENFQTSVIIDDDFDFKMLLPTNLGQALDDDLDLEEQQPVIAAIIDDRPDEVKAEEYYRSSNKWKLVGQTDAFGRSDGDSRDADDQSPPRRRHDSDDDASPARKPRNPVLKRGAESPPAKSRRRKSDSKGSPEVERDLSPPRRKRHDSDSDASPPRRPNPSTGDTSGKDANLPRRPQTAHVGSSAHPAKDSSPRRRRHDSDASPPRRKQPSRDSSPPRKSARDSSPRRKQSSPSRGSDTKRPSPSLELDSSGRPIKTLAGSRAGLQSGSALRHENELARQREEAVFARMNASESGKEAATVFRDRKSGKVRDLKEERRKKRELDEQKAEEAAKYLEWGKGVVQSKNQQQAVEDAVHEMSKPLARYRDDADLDKMQREQERAGDPMLALLERKHVKRLRKMGAVLRPVYRGPNQAPNRFGIRPGYRWDGVDRSNGFEKKLFEARNESKAVGEMAYRWSVDDM